MNTRVAEKKRRKRSVLHHFQGASSKGYPRIWKFSNSRTCRSFFNFVSRGTKLHSFRWYPPGINNVSWLAWWSVFREDFLWNEKTFLSRGNLSVLIMVHSLWLSWQLSGPCTSNHNCVCTWGDDDQFDVYGPRMSLDCHVLLLTLTHHNVPRVNFFLYLFTK